jgi:hypothetical protein
MAFKFADRIKETSTTTGTGDVTLAGAVTQFRAFSSVLSNGDTCYYAIVTSGGADWEVGLGTFVSATPAIARTTVLASSNAGGLVDLAAGSKDVFMTFPALAALTAYAGTLFPSISPAQISADQNNYAPTGIDAANALNLSASAAYALTGLSTGSSGRVVSLINSGATNILLTNEDENSTAANRFAIPDGLAAILPGAVAQALYDTVASRWRVLGIAGLGKGFFSGGYTTGYVATADRLTYSVETTAAAGSAALSLARDGAAAAGNALKSFFAGGYDGSNTATADKTVHATEVTSAVAGANLSVARRGLAAAGNTVQGFFSGGYTTGYVTTADKNSYATETTAAVAGAALSAARDSIGAASSATKAFFCGGDNGSLFATADKTTHATEVTAAVAGANLSQARYNARGAGNSLKAFFTGGYTTGPVATADRLTYATETTAAVVGANLSSSRRAAGGSGDAQKGFFCGGTAGSVVTTADRTNYTLETTAAVASAALSAARNTAASGTGF